MPIPRALSRGEEEFAPHCEVQGLSPAHEWKFHPKRRWRFDFAFPDVKLAIEIEGGIWQGGRHSRGLGFEEDCVKYAEAAILGWRVIRASTGQVISGQAIDWTLRALGL